MHSQLLASQPINTALPSDPWIWQRGRERRCSAKRFPGRGVTREKITWWHSWKRQWRERARRGHVFARKGTVFSFQPIRPSHMTFTGWGGSSKWPHRWSKVSQFICTPMVIKSGTYAESTVDVVCAPRLAIYRPIDSGEWRMEFRIRLIESWQWSKWGRGKTVYAMTWERKEGNRSIRRTGADFS